MWQPPNCADPDTADRERTSLRAPPVYGEVGAEGLPAPPAPSVLTLPPGRAGGGSYWWHQTFSPPSQPSALVHTQGSVQATGEGEQQKLRKSQGPHCHLDHSLSARGRQGGGGGQGVRSTKADSRGGKWRAEGRKEVHGTVQLPGCSPQVTTLLGFPWPVRLSPPSPPCRQTAAEAKAGDAARSPWPLSGPQPGGAKWRRFLLRLMDAAKPGREICSCGRWGSAQTCCDLSRGQQSSETTCTRQLLVHGSIWMLNLTETVCHFRLV